MLRKRKVELDSSLYAGVFAEGNEADQLYACGTLGRLPNGKSRLALWGEAAASRYHSVRQAAIYALESNGSEAARQVLAGLLSHDDVNVRYRAAVVLGRMQAGSAAAKLESLAASDASPEVRTAAAVATASDFGDFLPAMPQAPARPRARWPI